MKTVLVTGGSGVVGSFIAKSFANRYSVFATYRSRLPSTGVKSVQLDVTDNKAASAVIHKINPDIIIHAAGIKDVRKCEQDKEAARRLNVVGTANVAQAASDLGAFMVYISSDYVFEGTGGMYREDSPASPWTAYGRTKLEGEKKVEECCSSYAICRASGIYANSEKNVFRFILDALRNNQRQEYFADVFNSPTHLGNFADMVKRVIEKGKTATYHLAGSERINRYGFALKVADTFKCDGSLVKPLELGAERRRAEFRPFDLSLDVSRSQKLLGMEFFNVKEGLQAIKNETNIA